MGMVLLTDEVKEKNAFEGNKGFFLSMLDKEAWQSFLSEFNQRLENKAKVDNFKEELWDTVVKFGEPVLTGTGLDEKVRKELLEKMIGLRKQKQDTGANPKKLIKKISVEVDDKNKTSIIIKDTIIFKAREGRGKTRRKRIWTKKSSQ